MIIESETAPLAALLPAIPDLDALLADWPANSKLLGDAVEESRSGQRWASLARPVSDFARAGSGHRYRRLPAIWC